MRHARRVGVAILFDRIASVRAPGYRCRPGSQLRCRTSDRSFSHITVQLGEEVDGRNQVVLYHSRLVPDGPQTSRQVSQGSCSAARTGSCSVSKRLFCIHRARASGTAESGIHVYVVLAASI